MTTRLIAAIPILGLGLALAAEGGPAQPEAAAPPAAAPAPAAREMYAYLKDPDRKVALFSDASASVAVATIDGDAVTLRELSEALAVAHASHEPGMAAARADFAPFLERLIEVRLIVHEAREMGLDEMGDFTALVDEFKVNALREALAARATSDVRPDPEEVETLYRDAVRQWKIRTVFFDAEEGAKQMAEAVKGGKPFDDLAKELVAQKKAKGGEEGEFLSAEGMLPQVRDAVAKMKPGDVSEPIKVPKGHILIRLMDIRYPEDAQARAEAEQVSRDRNVRKALEKYFLSLVKKHAVVDRKLLKRIDFEAKKPGFEALGKDRRVLAKIAGEQPIRVADLQKALAAKFFHGMEGPIREKRVNFLIDQIFDDMLRKRLFTKEAKALGIQDAETYRKAVAGYVDSLLFGTFIQKVILPDVKVTEDESKQYYERHQSEITLPGLYKLDSMGFVVAQDAQSALGKLKAGTDFKWLKANAEGQLPEKDQLELGGRTVTATSLPPGLASAIAGAKGGEYRLYEGSAGRHFVIYVMEETPPKPQPYKEAREAIAKKLFAENLDKAVKDYAAKLRKAREVKVFITRTGS